MKTILTYIYIMTSVMMTAQNLSEAVRYSSLDQQSTARVAGVAGAFGSMGGDIGVVTINPSGIGEFRKGEFIITPTIYSVSSDASINGTDNTTTSDINSNLSFGSLGVVFSGRPRGSTFQTSNFAFSINKQSTLRQRFSYDGLTKGSITTRFAEIANGDAPENLDQFEGLLAYNTGAIYDINGDLNYDTDFKETTVVQKGQDVTRYGAVNEINFAWGGKLRENINIGLGVSLPVVSYEENKSYIERDEVEDFIPAFNSLEYNENLITSGIGFNVQGGIQAEMMNKFRVGLSMESPTWYNLNDDYNTSLTYSYVDPYTSISESFTAESPNGTYRYRLTSPWKATGSAGMIIRSEKLNGFVNLDVEYLDYSTNAFDFEKFGGGLNDLIIQNEINDSILDELDHALNIRLGGELAYGKIRGRAGVGLLSSPYIEQSEIDLALSAGLGFRFDGMYLDIAYSRRSQTDGYLPYVVIENEDNQVVTVNQAIANVDISIGFKF